MTDPARSSWRARAERFVTRPAPAALVDEFPAHVAGVLARLVDAGYEAVAVGGGVRDALLGRAVFGLWDLATAATPAQVIALFPGAVPTGIEHGTVTLPDPAGAIEITSYRTDHGYSDARRPDEVRFGVDLVTDLERRDFTINALVYEPASGLVLDAVGGLADLEARVLRAVGDPVGRFREDALRPVRGARLAAVLDFGLDPATEAALAAAADLVPRLSAERVRDELEKMLAAPKPSIGFELLRRSGLLALLLPELEATVGVRQNRHHAFDVYHHTLRAIDAAPATNGVVRWAALAHDLGKPATRAVKDDGEASFHGHPAVGAEIADAMLTRLRLPRAVREAIVHLVAEHLFEYRPEWTDAAVRRFVKRVGEANLADLFALRAADAAGTREGAPDLTNLETFRARIAAVLAARPPLSTRELALDGRELMTELDLAPGPRVGAILAALVERVLDDPALNTRERLLELARALPDALPRGGRGAP
ncbi:MAG: HD domain-containing protein [Candidatus Eisenbacteria bacterium]